MHRNGDAPAGTLIGRSTADRAIDQSPRRRDPAGSPEGSNRRLSAPRASEKSQRRESNPQPPHYECGALPIEATLAHDQQINRRNNARHGQRWSADRPPMAPGPELPKAINLSCRSVVGSTADRFGFSNRDWGRFWAKSAVNDRCPIEPNHQGRNRHVFTTPQGVGSRSGFCSATE